MSGTEQSAKPLDSTQLGDTMKNVLCETNKDATKSLFIDEIRGYDLNEGINYDKIFQSYRTTGFQATNFSKAVDEINRMVSSASSLESRSVRTNINPIPQKKIQRKSEPLSQDKSESGVIHTNCTIFLGYTSNMMSSGIREYIRYLVKNKMV
jgi:deoxyhypusine synthase